MMSDKEFRDACAIQAISLFSISDRENALLELDQLPANHGIVTKFCFDLAQEMSNERSRRH